MQIHIARDSIELGLFDVSDVEELLANGFLLPSDLFWTRDAREARPLAEFRSSGGSTTRHAAKNIAASVLSAADVLRQKATSVTARLAATVSQRTSEIDGAKNRVLQDFLPRLRSSAGAVLATTSRTVESALRDEPFLRKLFGAVYEVIPRPVQRFVPERTFVEFCLRNRNRLLGKEGGASETVEPENHP